MLMLDLCCGLKGASAAMRDRGWQVVTLDIDPRFDPDIVADVREWSWQGEQPDLIWLSDPCTEFSREFMPWCKTGKAPDLSIVHGGLRAIQAAQPRYWARENVRGSASWVRPFLGEPREIHGPFFLWGNFPPIGRPRLNIRKKESMSSSRASERAKIPYAISEALAVAVESQMVLL